MVESNDARWPDNDNPAVVMSNKQNDKLGGWFFFQEKGFLIEKLKL